jgi:glucokinase
MTAAARMVADVGGTNCRIALFDERSGKFHALAEYHNSDFDCLEQILDTWLAQLEEEPPTRACIAAAAPPGGDQVNMINIGWSFSCRELARRFGLSELTWLNDFQANAHSLPHLGAADLERIQAGQEGQPDTLATVGPGTGLGGATLRWIAGVPVACDSEPGHTGLSPVTDLELEIFRALLPEYGEIQAELLVSGSGLARLYRTIAELNGAAPEDLSPADVSTRALAGSDQLCIVALQTFCALLGSACGDYVLSNGAYGGLFIAGGIVPRMTEFLHRSDFLRRFQAKGAMQEHLAAVPVHVITAAHPGLVGAANAPLQAS